MKKQNNNRNSNQPREVTLTVDGVWDTAKKAWGLIRSHQLTFRVEKI